MESWHWTTLILCAFGFFKEFRPSEPYVTRFLIDFHHFTREEVYQIAYPIATYTYLGVLPLVFLLTDLVRYRLMIIVEALGFVTVYIMLIWGKGMTNLVVLEIAYGIATATEVAYYTYIYTKVDKANYDIVTSFTYSAIFIGNLAAAVASQILVSMKWMNSCQLNYLSLAGTGISFIIALCLPRVRQSIYFYPREDHPIDDIPNPNLKFHQRVGRAYNFLFRDFKAAYSNSYILKWSIWWGLATAVFLQVANYYQSLWEITSPDDAENDLWNGGVGAIQACLSAIIAVYVARLKINWEKWGEACLSIISIIEGGFLIWMAKTSNIYISYALYITFRIFYQVLITVASAQVAKNISDESYGLIFGINTFVAVFVQTVITLTITGKGGLALDMRKQFIVYGSYFIVLGILFLSVAAVTIICRRKARPLELDDNLNGHQSYQSGTRISKS